MVARGTNQYQMGYLDASPGNGDPGIGYYQA